MINFNALAEATKFICLSADQLVLRESCEDFVSFLQKLSTAAFKENGGLDEQSSGRDFISAAAQLQVGYFKDLEILCAIYDVTFQIVSSLRSKELNFQLRKRDIVSAFSVSGSDDSEAVTIVVNSGEGCLGFLSPVKRQPTEENLKNNRFEEEQELEISTELLNEVLEDGERNLKNLQSVISELKDRMHKAGDVLKRNFTAEESRVVVLHRLNRVLRSLLSFSGLEDTPGIPGVTDFQSYRQVSSEVGDGTVTIMQLEQKIVSDLLSSEGPLVTGITGPEGSGKTFLASSVASNGKIKQRFIGGIYWVTATPKTEVSQLQCNLWKAVAGSPANFTSVIGGRTEIRRKFSYRTPSLLIVDNACTAAQAEGLLGFDNKHQGRIIVTTCNPEIALAVGAFVHELSGIKEQDALNILEMSMGNDHPLSSEQRDVGIELVHMCNGSPLLIHAVMNMLHIPFPHDRIIIGMLKNRENKLGNKEKGLVPQSSFRLESEEEFCGVAGPSVFMEKKSEEMRISLLTACFCALGFIHPILQECFLDLIAFPEGEWIALSTLEELWLSCGNGLSPQEIMVILSILVCRSILDWRVNLSDGSKESIRTEFKLHKDFYSLASSISHENFQENMNICNINNEIWLGISCWEKYLNRIKVPCRWMGNRPKRNLPSPAVVSVEFTLLANKMPSENTSSPGKQWKRIARPFNWRSDFPRFKRESRLVESNSSKISFKVASEESASKTTKIFSHSSSTESFSSFVESACIRVCILSENEKISSLSSSFVTKLTELLVLDLKGCLSLRQLPKEISVLKSLKILDVSFCRSLKSLTSSLGCLENLKCLKVSGCTLLATIPKAVGKLYKLEILDLSGCINLRSLPSSLGQLCSLRILDLKNCRALHSLPSAIGSLRGLRYLDLSSCCNLSYSLPFHTNFWLLLVGNHTSAPVTMAVPFDMWDLDQIEVVKLSSLNNLTFLPPSIGRLQRITQLDLSGCRRLDGVAEEIGEMQLLQELNLSYTAIRKLPDSVGNLGNLIYLRLKGCCRLLSIPSSISNLRKLRFLDLSECWGLVILPNSIGHASALCELQELDLGCCSFNTLPAFSPQALPKLQCLSLVDCSVLHSLPATFRHLTSLEKLDLEGCQCLSSLQDIGLDKLGKLRWLSLRNCTSLTSLQLEELAGFSSLKYLDISGCAGFFQVPQTLASRVRQGDLVLVRWGAVWQEAM